MIFQQNKITGKTLEFIGRAFPTENSILLEAQYVAIQQESLKINHINDVKSIQLA